jgi:hypothetical protein
MDQEQSQKAINNGLIEIGGREEGPPGSCIVVVLLIR